MTEQNPSETPSQNPPEATTPGPPPTSGRWWWIIILAIAVVIAISYSRNRPAPSETTDPRAAHAHKDIPWNHDYQAALEQAQKDNKPLLLAFHASWCGPCRQMKSQTYPDPAVAHVIEAFVPVMIDTDQQAALAEKFAIRGIPAYIIINPDGSEITRFEGFHNPSNFAARLKNAL